MRNSLNNHNYEKGSSMTQKETAKRTMQLEILQEPWVTATQKRTEKFHREIEWKMNGKKYGTVHTT